MNKYPLIGKLLVVVITLLFIGTFISPSTAQETEKSLPTIKLSYPFITFPAIITIELDNDSILVLNQPLTPGETYYIKLIIGYCVIAPQWLFGPWFRILKHIFLFNSPVDFPQKIHLTVDNVPDWADIYSPTPDIYIDTVSYIPDFVFANLIFSIHDDAPATSHSISVTASAPPIHRILRQDYSVSLYFTVDD
jgi:hypothetical protein